MATKKTKRPAGPKAPRRKAVSKRPSGPFEEKTSARPPSTPRHATHYRRVSRRHG